jgi:vitamin B12 transporter
MSLAARSNRSARDLVPACCPASRRPAAKQLEAIPPEQRRLLALDLNSEAFRAQGIESTVESGIGKTSFFAAVTPTSIPWCSGPSPATMRRCRAATRPPLTAFPVGHLLAARGRAPLPARAAHRLLHGHVIPPANHRRLHLGLRQPQRRLHLSGLRRSRFKGNSLLLPNRNLDHGYAKLDLGGSYQCCHGWRSTRRPRTF